MKRTTPTASILLAALALGATALGVTGGACRAEPSVRQPERPADVASSTRPGGAPLFVAQRFKLGTRRVYNVETGLELMLLPPSSERGEGQILTIGFSGILSATVIRLLGPTEIEVAIAAADPWAGKRDHSTMDPDTKRAIIDSLQAPFYVRTNARGAITSLRFRRGLDPIAQGMLKSMMAVAAFVDPPPGQTRTTWTADESDPTGEYTASYRRLDGHLVFEKTRSSYRRVSNGGKLVPVEQAGVFETSLRSRFKLDELGWPESVESREQLRVHSGPGTPIVASTSKTMLTLTGSGVGAAASLAQGAAEYETVSMLALQAPEGAQRLRDEQLVGGASLALLKDKLEKVRGERDEGAARAAVQDQMEAFFRLHPEAAHEALALLEGSHADTTSTVLAALSAAATPEAQAALVDQAQMETEDAAVRVHALASLGLTLDPTADTLAALEQATTDTTGSAEVRATAALALGNAARQLAESDLGDDATDAVEHLLLLFKNARTPEEQALALQALGNTGDSRALPAIEAALGSPHGIVRGAAALALRFVDDPSVDPVVGSLIRRDPAASVRRSAIFAAGFRPLDALIPALHEAARADTDPGVRLDAVKTIGAALPNHFALAALLRWSAEHDPSAEVRDAASSYLNP